MKVSPLIFSALLLLLCVGCGVTSTMPEQEPVRLGVQRQALLCNDTLNVGQSVTKTMTVTLPQVPPKADIMFSSDLTSSMVEEVAKAKSNSTNIMNQITNLIPDTWFGAMSFKDYAKSYNHCGYGQGSPVLYGSGSDFPYKLDQAITSNKTSVSSAINTWAVSTDPLTDYPATYTRALWEMYNDTKVGWRLGSKRFIILFADALPHDCAFVVNPYNINTGVDPGRDEKAGTSDDLKWDATITGLKNNNISVITLYSGDSKLSLGGGPPLRIFDFWLSASRNTGGDAFQLSKQGSLPNGTDIAQFIQQKVQALSANISKLTIELCKDQDQQYASWLSNPGSKTNVTSGTGPHSLNITVTPPSNAASKTHTFAVCIYGDGVEYARDTCAITISGCNLPGVGDPCTVGTGACQRTGTKQCNTAGNALVCSATAGTPTAEKCDNIDNDCDGSTDEGLSQTCYTGASGTAGTGPCKTGTQTCAAGRWGTCSGQVVPATETCDGIDNDCDGPIDETFSTKGNACTAGVGACKRSGKFVCNSAKTGVVCDAKAGSPTPEKCDGIDNDCDGSTDETFTTLGQSCQGGQGSCSATGKFICKADGSGVECSAKGTPGAPEVCDNLDNDCDGQVDETFTTKGRACSVGVGECKATGVNVCNSAKNGVVCNAKAKAAGTETCDNKDNDCDGQIDESLTKTCSNACGRGSQICQKGAWSPCDAPKPGTETCDNKDNDCNGQIDDGLTRDCTSDCGKGTETCKAGQWVGCTAPATTTEVCDGKDNDCNGKIDDGVPTKPCQGACGSGTAQCESGVYVGCTGLQPKPEECDGLDNDCDGKVDNLDPRACRSECGEGKETCVEGFWKNCDAPKPDPEVCDGKDNNCDGFVDNKAPCPDGQGCNTRGVCAPVCKADKDCGEGGECFEGFCTDDPCKGVNCDEGKTCISGHCVDACALLTCPDGQVCRNGKCQEDSCYALGCPGGQICKAGKCEVDPCLAASCKPQQACRNGNCVDSCAWVRCPLGKKCNDGQCVDDTCQTTTCNQGQVCVEGKCIEDPCALLDCKEGRICDPKAKQCIDDPCLTLTCPNGQVCRDGQCAATAGQENPNKPENPGSEVINKNQGDAGNNDGSSTDSKSPGGCGCNSTSPTHGSLFLLLLLLPLLWRKPKRNLLP